MFPKNNKNIFFLAGIGALLSLFAVSQAWAKVDLATRYLERGTSLAGPTGWVNIPSASVPGSGNLSAGIHLNRAKINIGLFDFIEAGLFFNADELAAAFEPYRNLSRWDLVEKNVPAFLKDAFRGQAKLKLLDQDWAAIGLAVGVEEQDYYCTVQRFFTGLSNVTLLVGWGTGRFEKGYFGLGKTLFPGSEMIFEYDATGINIGIRMLLASNLVLSIAGRNLDTIGEVQNLGEVISDHLIFGITYVEKLW
ncbi:hypothetical protein K8S19_06590 [bacterium]|nr:hypothetical protein [bacterium]